MKQKKNYKWLIYFTVFLIIITTAPYCIACSQTSNYEFSGFLFGIEDGNSYFAKMLRGAYGYWLFKTPYTAIEQNGVIAFLPYAILGKLTSSTEQHSQFIALFHLFRAIGITFYVYGSYYFIKLFITNNNLVRFGVVLASLGGGGGWLSVLGLSGLWANHLPLEFYSPETFGFLSIYGLPHLAFSRGLLLLGFSFFLESLESKSGDNKRYIFGIVSWTLLGFFQPLTVAIGIALLGVYTIVSFIIENGIYGLIKRDLQINKLKPYLKFIAIPSLWVIYNFLAFSFDPFLSTWQDQNIIKSPAFFDYILAFLFILPFTLLGIREIMKSKNPIFLFPIVWIICFPILAYAPYNLQRRLPEGVWLAFIIPALLFFESQNSAKISKFLRPFILVLCTISQAMILAAGFQLASHPSAPVFLPKEEVIAFEYFAEISNPGDVILAAYETSNAIPAWAPVHVLIGHGPESYQLEYYQELTNKFYFGSLSEDEIELFFQENSIDYVFFGPEEKKIGSYPEVYFSASKIVFSSEKYQIFTTHK